MNRWDQMNDPFESRPVTFTGGGAFGDVPNLEERLAEADKHAPKIRGRARLTCFTAPSKTEARPSTPGWFLAAPYARPRMWDQYGDKHRGVCLVFDRAALQETAQAAGQGTITFSAVEYTEGGFHDTQGASAPDLAGFDVGGAEEAVFEHSLRYFYDFLFVKTLDWAAEHEYRFVLDPDSVGFEPIPPDEQVFLPIESSLRYVMIGQEFPEERLPALLEVLAGYPDVEVRRVLWENGIVFPVIPKSILPRPR